MSDLEPPDPGRDPFGPPVIPTIVGCLHCREEYDSYRIEWRVEQTADGRPMGFWCCPTPGCGGMGFGFDILPVDPNYQDEHGGWIHTGDDEEDEDEIEDDAELPEGARERPPDDDDPLSW